MHDTRAYHPQVRHLSLDARADCRHSCPDTGRKWLQFGRDGRLRRAPDRIAALIGTLPTSGSLERNGCEPGPLGTWWPQRGGCEARAAPPRGGAPPHRAAPPRGGAPPHHRAPPHPTAPAHPAAPPHPAAPAPRWQRLDHDERRRQILACARQLFRAQLRRGVDDRDRARGRRRAGPAAPLLRDQARPVPRGRAQPRADASNPVPLQRPARHRGRDRRERRSLADDARAQPRHLAGRDRRAGLGAIPRSRRSSTRRASRRPTG